MLLNGRSCRFGPVEYRSKRSEVSQDMETYQKLNNNPLLPLSEKIQRHY